MSGVGNPGRSPLFYEEAIGGNRLFDVVPRVPPE